MIRFTLIVFSITFFCGSYETFSCEGSFVKIDKITVKELRNLNAETIRNLPPEEVHKFTGEQLKLLNSEQLTALPFRHLLLSQVRALDYRVNDIFSKDIEMQERDPEIFSLLIRINLQHVSNVHIPLISPKQIRKWESSDIRKLTDKQISAFEVEQIVAFGKLIEQFSPEQIQAFGENIQHFLPEQFAAFTFTQHSALTLGQLAVLDKDQRHSLVNLRHNLY